MRRRRRLTTVVAAALAGAVPTAFPAWPAGAAASQAAAICSSSSHPALAARIGRDILPARRGRVSAAAVGVNDPGMGVVCWLNRSWRFDSASVVKVTILGALLRRTEDQHRYLTGIEAARARAMITRSDNDAASALWAELRPARRPVSPRTSRTAGYPRPRTAGASTASAASPATAAATASSC